MTDQQTPDAWENRDDDHEPMTKGEGRRLRQQLASDLKWTAVMLMVGNQALSPVDLPPSDGFASFVGIRALCALRSGRRSL